MRRDSAQRRAAGGATSPRLLGRALLLFLLLAGSLLVAASPPAAAGSAAARPVVRVGTEGTYPPFTYQDPQTGALTGFDIEVIRAVAAKAGWDLQFTKGSFDSLFPALDAHRIDVIANQVTINPDRQAHYLFTRPYTYSHGVIVTAAGNNDITSLADLKGKTAAETPTSNWTQVAKDAGAKIQYVDQFSQAAALLAQGRVDAVVNDNIAVLDYLKSSGSDKIKIAGNAGNAVSKQALVFRQSDPTLDQAAAAPGPAADRDAPPAESARGLDDHRAGG